MPTVADVTVKFGADTSGVDEGINHVNSVLGGLGKRVGSAVKATGSVLGSGLAQGLTQLTGGFDAVIAQGLDFGKQMANVNSILKLSDTGFNQLTKDVLGLTNNPGIRDMPAQLASGLYDIASAGFTGQDGLTILEQSAIAASAGVTQTSVAADALTSVLGAYGLGADQAKTITDQMFQTVNDGKISFEELASNMGNVLPMAAKFGVGFDQIGAAFAQMTLQGIPAAQVQTQLASLMQTALNPTEALTNAVRAQGYANAESALSALGLSGYINLIDESADSTGLTLYDLLGTTEGVNAALALGGPNAAAYADEIERVDHASDGLGATQEALNEQMKSLSFQLDKLKQQAMTLATVLIGFVAPSFAKLAGFGTKGLGKLTGWFQGIGDSYNKLRNMKPMAIGNKIGITGPDGEMVFSRMGRMTALTTVLSAKFTKLTGIKADNWFKRMGESILRPFNATKKLMGALTDRDWDKALAGFGDLIASGPKAVGDFFKGIETGIKPVDKLLHTFGKSWTDVGRLIQEAGQGDWAGFQVVLDRLGGHLLDLGGQLGGFAIDAVSKAVDITIDLVPKVGEWLWDLGGDFVSWAIGHIPGSTGGDGTGGPDMDNLSKTDLLLSLVPKVGKWLWDKGSEFFSWAVAHIKDGANVAANVVQAGFELIPKLLRIVWGAAGDFGGWVKSTLTGEGAGGMSVDPSYAGAGGYHTGSGIPLGEVGLSFIATLAGNIWGALGTGSAWLKSQIEEIAVDGLVAVISFVDPTWEPGADLSFQGAIDALLKQTASNKTYEVPVGTYVKVGEVSYDAGEIVHKLMKPFENLPAIPPTPMGMMTGINLWVTKTFGPATLRLFSTSVINFFKGAAGIEETTDISASVSNWVQNTLVKGITDWFGDWELSAPLNPFRGLGGKVYGWARDGFTSSIDYLSQEGSLYDDGKELGGAILDAVTGGISSVFGSGKDAVFAGGGNSLDLAHAIGGDDPLGIGDMVSGWISGATDSITGKADEWGGEILGALGGIVPDAGSLKAIGSSLIDGIWAGMKGAWAGLKNWMYEKYVEFATWYNNIVSPWNNLPGVPDIPTLPLPEKPDTYPHETPGDGKVSETGSRTGGANGNRVGIIDETSSSGNVLSLQMAKELAEAAKRTAAQGNPMPETVTGPDGQPAAGPVGAPVAEPPKEEKSPFVLPRKQLSLATPYSDLSKNAITALDPLRTGVPRVFSDMSQGIDRSTTTTSRDTVKSFTGMGADVIAQMTSMQGGSLAAAGLMSSGVVGGAGLMQAGTTGAAGAMNSGVVGQANSMSSGAILAAMQMAMGVYNVVSVIPVMLSTIDLRGAGYAIGASLGEGLVAGLYSQLSAVQTAAAALATAASNRTQKELGINSPSKVFMRIGESVGEGFVDGIESGYAAVAAAGREIGRTAVQPVPNPAWTGGAGRGSGGDTYITIVTPDSERFSEIARDSKRGAVFARDLGTMVRNI